MFDTVVEVDDIFGVPLTPEILAARAAREARAADPHADPELSDPVQALVEAVSHVTDQDSWRLRGRLALEDTKALLRQIERLRAATLGRLADVERRRLFLDDGAPTIGTWLAAQHTGIERGQLTLARRLARLEDLDGALKAGALSIDAAQHIARALSTLRRHLDHSNGLIDGQPAEQALTGVIEHGVRNLVCQALGGLPDDDPRLTRLTEGLRTIAHPPFPKSQARRLEAAFLLLATQLEPAQLPRALATLVDALLPAELEKRAADAHTDRGLALTLNPDGSGWTITRGDLDLELGELLHTVLTATMATDPDNPTDTAAFEQLRAAGWQSGDDLPPCDRPRSLAQRRHDALALALRAVLDTGSLGQRDKTAPHLAITISLDTLHDQPGALPAVASSGARVPASLARRWACDSAITRFVLSLGRKIIETSHTERTLKPHERRSKHLETGGHCQGAGCTRGPGHRLIPHHVTPYAHCRTTSLSDTVLLCDQTHHDVHSGHTTIRLKDGRQLNEHGWVTGPTATGG